jgi:AraC-like DNA-binding protein
MVKIGQREPDHQKESTFPYLQFTNPDGAQLDVQVTRYSTLKAQWPPGAAGAVHRTNFHQLLLVTQGAGTATVDFVDVRCRPGTLMYVYPGRAVRLPHESKGATAIDADLILFTPTFLPRWEEIDSITDPFRAAFWSLTPEAIAELRLAIDPLAVEYRVLSDSKGFTDLDMELLRHLLAAFLLRLARIASLQKPFSADSPGGPRAAIFQRFQRELEESFSSTRNATYYARRLGYSLRTLNRACESATGSTAKTIIDARVTLEAKRQLAHTELPASTIGRQLGFSEAANFRKFFIAEAGVAPGEFRRTEQRRSANRHGR